MPVASADLIFCGAAAHAEDDSAGQGGAIDTSVRIVFEGLEMSATDQVKLYTASTVTVSYRVTGRDGGGSIVTEDFAFAAESGTKTGTQAFERILKIEKLTGGLASGATMAVQEKTAGTTKCYLYGSGVDVAGVEVTEVRRLFIGATRPGSSTTARYEKFFILNTSGDDVSEAEVKETADPDGLMTFAVATSKDDTESTANRLTAPTSVSAFDNADKDVPTTNLAGGEAIGVWACQTLASTTTVGVSSFNTQLYGKGF